MWIDITNAHALAEWLEPNDHKPIVGHKFQFRCDPGTCGSGVTECEVIEADAPRRLVWKWVHTPKNPKRPRPEPMIISWTLLPKEGGRFLILEQTGAENIDWLTRNMMRVGWGFMMKKLIPRVLGGVKDGKFTPGAIPLNKRYYAMQKRS